MNDPIFTETEIIFRGHHYDRKLIERIIAAASDPKVKHIVKDCFSGIGGVTGGFFDAPGWMVIVCLNHWDKAIETHKLNYPDCLHLEEDFKSADLEIIRYMIDEIKKNNPDVQVHIWWSFECTNFSGAKGGMSRDADSRSLAEDADRYIKALNPDVMWVENVREFELWGPMIPKVVSTHLSKKGNIVKNKVIIPKNVNEIDYYNVLINNGRILSCPLIKEKDDNGIEGLYKWMIPDPYLKGQDYQRWKKYICSFGYDVDRKLLNCADYGVPQHRIRLIMKFVRNGMPITWPKPTHSKAGKNSLPKWLPVGPCLNLDKEGESIISFKKNKKGEVKIGKNGLPVPRIKSAKTIQRAIKGCIKHALKGKTSWIMKPNSAKNNTDVSSGSDINNSSPAVTCFNGLNIATAHTIDYYYGTNGSSKSIDKPAWQTGTKDGGSLQSIQFIVDYNHGSTSSSIKDESKAILAAEKYALGTTYFIGHEYTGDQQKSLEEPCGSLNGIPKQNVLQVDHFIMGTGFNNGDDRSVELSNPSSTITANRKHYYIISSHWFEGNAKGIDSPANTVIARMDKAPPYLITTEMGELAIEVNDYDPPHYKVMKKFMAENGIIAINMRMLEEEELLKIMTLDNHKLIASATDNKKMIGNAVPKKLVTALANDHDNGIQNIRTLFNNKAA